MNFIDRLRRRSSDFSDLPALIAPPRRWTHAELWDRVDRLSQALFALDLNPGDRLLAWLSNSPRAIEGELAALQTGAVWTSLNARLAAAEVEAMARTCEPRVVIADGERIESARDVAASVGARFIAIGAGANEAQFDCERPIASSPAERPQSDFDPESLARLRYTSGTTGRAKAVCLPLRIYHASLDNLRAELHPLAPDDRVLHAAPLTHASGALVFPILAAGGASVVCERFDAGAVLQAIERERITTTFLAPTMLARLVAHPDFQTRDLSSLRTVMYGGASMPRAPLLAAIERIGPALVHIYGMTEAPYPITTLKREEHRAGGSRLDSIGRPTAICRVSLRDDAGREVEDGQVGELWVAGPNVMSGYWRDEAETARALREGWLASGDLARRDAEGCLYIVGRKKDVIISGGFNVYAAHVESTLGAHPAVAEAAVVGAPDEEWGERVVAWIATAPRARVDARELDAWCRERLAGYERPKEYRFIDALPKNPSGKVLKGELK
jgi:acyl-CoA synthetase (AMP-forming)/AMP-acid ligase II